MKQNCAYCRDLIRKRKKRFFCKTRSLCDRHRDLIMHKSGIKSRAEERK